MSRRVDVALARRAFAAWPRGQVMILASPWFFRIRDRCAGGRRRNQFTTRQRRQSAADATAIAGVHATFGVYRGSPTRFRWCFADPAYAIHAGSWFDRLAERFENGETGH
jgi:hypothetical protein